MKLEFCIDGVDGMRAATKYGADRVELCADLEVGGLTPKAEMVRACSQISTIEIHAMIRNTTNGFVYSADDINKMKEGIKTMKEAGASGVVFGCLNPMGNICQEHNHELIQVSRKLGIEATFHRAFDYCADPLAGLESIMRLGFDRLLTSGQKETAIEGTSLLKTLAQQADQKIEVMAGSGVNASNAGALIQTGVDALHFTIHHKTNAGPSQIDELKIRDILKALPHYNA